MEGKPSDTVRVEENKKTVQFAATDSITALITQELLNFVFRHLAITIAVESLEGGVRGEITDSAESLTSTFQGLFSISDRNEIILQVML